MGKPHVYRIYSSRRDAVDTQILDESQMEDACALFAQRHVYRHRTESKRLATTYARLMWLCAIEGAVSAIYVASLRETAYSKASAFLAAESYAQAYDKTWGEWTSDPWPIPRHMHSNSDAISAWVAAGKEQTDDSPGYIAVLSAVDDMRHTLMRMADHGKLV